MRERFRESRRKRRRNALRCYRLLMCMLLVLWAVSCQTFSSEPTEAADAQSESERTDVPGNAQRGAQLIRNYGCSACHTIPGIIGADTHVGPPLTGFSERRFVAGSLINTPENTARWIQNPQEIEPNTAMPDVGANEADARDITAYLYTLE